MRLAAVGTAVPPHYYDQPQLLAALTAHWNLPAHQQARLETLHRNVLVGGRHLAIPITDYPDLDTWGKANDAWIRVAQQIGEQAIQRALEAAGLAVSDIGAIFFVSVTGISTPSIDARLANRMGFPPTVKRNPIFGLGCVAGAAGIARAADYVRAFPDEVAVLLAVELCSLTLQREDLSLPNLIASGLFGDGAAAAVITGDRVAAPGPRILATRSVFYPGTEGAMGWDISERGFKIVLDPSVPDLARNHPELGLPPRRAEGPRRGRRRPGAGARGARAVVALAGRGREPVVGVGAVRAGRHDARTARPAGRQGPAARDGSRLLLGTGAVRVVSALPGGTRAAFLVLVAVVALQRLAELALSRAHVRRMKARGGREAAAAHYPAMVALHAAFLAAAPLEVLLLERPFRPALALVAIGVLLIAEALRVWTLSALGDRWSTRVIVVPGEPVVTGGPFRFLRHPNYLVVALEIVALPLVHSAWLTAIVFSALNAALMAVRIPAEERALAEASRA